MLNVCLDQFQTRARGGVGVVAVFVLAWCAAMPAAAQTYPAQTVKMIVGFPPGGTTDVIARLVAQGLTEALGKSIADDAPGSAPLQGLAGSFNAMVGAVVAIPGSRHLICVSSAAGGGFDELKASADRARRGEVAVHAIVPPDCAGTLFFEALCRDTGGGFYPISGPDEIPAILQRIQVSLFDRYEISFSRTNPEVQDLTVRICSPRGYGEAKVTASPSLRAARDS